MTTSPKRAPLLLAISIAAAALAVPTRARAQRGIDSQLFHPALDGYGIFTVERAQTSHQWDFGFKLYLNYAGSPMKLPMFEATASPPGPRLQAVMDRQLALNLGAHLGLTNWLELVLDIPVSSQSYTAAYGINASEADPTLTRTGFFAADPRTNIGPPDAAPLDARLGLKARLFRKGMFGMAALAVVTVPFGDKAAFLGDTNFTFRPTIVGDFTRGGLTAAINIGAVLRQSTQVVDPHDVAMGVAQPRIMIDVGHELTWSAGVAYRIVHYVGVAAEIYGLVPLLGAQGGARQDYAGDVLGGLQIFPAKDTIISLGAGASIFRSSFRSDDYRAFLGISWAPVEGGKGAVAAGGLDSDGDGIPDAVDQCPNEPEDKDGFEDEDGCPDPDNDGDGIPDKLDKCPNEAEDRDGFQDEDGCPDLDNDNDGVPDAMDKCPNDPEDRDGFQDDDGCPDADNDGDGIPDSVDKCPNEPETRNGVDDEDGCPDSGGTVVATGPKIEIPDVINFDPNKAQPGKLGFGALDKIAEKLKGAAGVKRVRIEGHADVKEGAPKKRQALSQERADAVREYLIKKGVEAERLQAVGYGAERPVDKRTTADARAKNRRVEFVVVDQ